jgi:hypothetical protein
MDELIQLDCAGMIDNYRSCCFIGHRMADDSSWAVYRRTMDQSILVYDKDLKAIYILDEDDELVAFPEDSFGV